MSMMRIAVAGTGGIARTIVDCIAEETSHQVVLLSRSAKPQLSARGYQVLVVNYSDLQNLQFALRGIDTVISTVTGPNQIELIKAAVQAKVRRFAPAEFEGPPGLRGQNDPLDRGRTQARHWLDYYSQHIHSTVFVCGVFYERFQPGGLIESAVGVNSGFGREGEYILNCRGSVAQAPIFDANNQPNVTICMTSMEDVGRFVTRALDIPQWNVRCEMRICGARISVKQLVDLAEQLTGRHFTVVPHNPVTIIQHLQMAQQNNDVAQQVRLHALLSTAVGRYDFAQAATTEVIDLNARFPDIQITPFNQWFLQRWASLPTPI